MSSPRLVTLVLLFMLPISFVHAQKRVLGVLFVESDTTETPEMVPAVLHQLKLVQREFLRNFQATFTLDPNPVRVIRADHPGAWYVDTRSSDIPGNLRTTRWDRMENIREEVVRKLSLDENVRVLVYPTSKHDGKSGAYRSQQTGRGGYMDFDDITCVYGAGESTPYPDNNEAVCGAHEVC